VSEKIDTGKLAAEIRDAGNVLWQGEPDPGSFFAGQTRAMRLKLAGAIFAGVLAVGFIAFLVAAGARHQKDGDRTELGVPGLIAGNAEQLYYIIAAAAAAAGAFLAVRRSRRMVGRTTYYLTQSAILVFQGVRAARYDLDTVAGVERRPGRGGGERGDVRVELLPMGDDRTLREGGETVVLYGVEDPERVRALVKRAWMERLRQRGCGIFDRDFADDFGNTHLMHAVAVGDLEKVQALIAAGARVDAGNRVGLTPLMSAVKGGRAEVVRCLLEANADRSAVDLHDKTALDYAREGFRPEIAALVGGGTPAI
jgi:hypothetical protein